MASKGPRPKLDHETRPKRHKLLEWCRPSFYALHYTGAAFTWRNSIKMISLNTSIDLDRILLTAPPGQEMAIIYTSGEA